ncbi:MAG: hypothetical protein HY706_20060 [Candidatus Hydrogenedentes bacterium]|nr:hypothetical protein [Candidatus Hydrogenedentota bacterium]
MSPISRRQFLGATVGAAVLAGRDAANSEGVGAVAEFDFPIQDLHVHLDRSTLDAVLALSKERNVTFGIVEHAGTKENQYPVVLSNDAELTAYLQMLEGKPALKGIQAEWIDWMGCFSPAALAGLDFVLSDAMTLSGKDGQRAKLWEKGVEIGDPQVFMDRYVDWHVKVMTEEPLDILANVTWLPDNLVADYDALWTEPRMTKVIETAVKQEIALEISSGYNLPKLPFLKLAKSAGAKFTFGSNGRYPKMGLLDYPLQIAREFSLTRADMFLPTPGGAKIARRSADKHGT